MTREMQYQYHIAYKRIKNLILKIDAEGGLLISAPHGVSEEQIERFIQSKVKWIESRMRMLEKKRLFLHGETIELMGKPLVLEVVESERESVRWVGNRILIHSKESNDSLYNQKLFYKKFSPLIERVFRALLDEQGGEKVVLKIRDMKRRWGTCFVGRNTIQINKRLIHAPKELITYVIIHELIHFQEANHGSRYYEALEKRLKDWKKLKKELNDGYGCYL